MEIDNIEFGKRLKLALKKSQISQKDAAEKLEVSKNAINNYAQGRIPDATILYKIARLLGVSIEWLLTGVNDSFVKDEMTGFSDEEYDQLDLQNQLLDIFNELERDEKLIAIGELSMFARMYNSKKIKSSNYQTTEQIRQIDGEETATKEVS